MYIVGTAHVSKKSAEDVERVIRAVRPDAVVVELCKSRSGIMQSPEEEETTDQGLEESEEELVGGRPVSGAGVSSSSSATRGRRGARNASNMLQLSGGGSGFFSAIGRSVQLGGQSALLLRVLMANLAGLAADQLGVQGGLEFVAARKAAEEVGAQIVLGDRPIEITLKRAWEALPWRSRVQMCRELLAASFIRPSEREVKMGIREGEEQGEMRLGEGRSGAGEVQFAPRIDPQRVLIAFRCYS